MFRESCKRFAMMSDAEYLLRILISLIHVVGFVESGIGSKGVDSVCGGENKEAVGIAGLARMFAAV